MELKDIIGFESFENFNKSFERKIASLKSPPIWKYLLCMDIAQLYKHISEIDGLRDEAERNAVYFSELALEYFRIAKIAQRNRRD